MSATVEYLAIIPKTDSFCDSVATFKKLLETDSSLTLKKTEIGHGKDFVCGYHISAGEVAGKDQRYFHLRFTLPGDGEKTDEEIERFSDFLKVIRGLIGKAGGQTETLWDDTSFHYLRKAYPLICRAENLMRRLIAHFMLITVGKEWVSETAPAEFQEAVSKSKRKAGSTFINVLHSVDFIHLADFLLRPYSRKTTQELHKKINDIKAMEEVADLKNYIPRSNWTRYFSALVNCEDLFLEKRWRELYDLRCMVAHNAIVGRVDYEKIVKLSTELTPIIEQAINKLPDVSVPAEELETVAEQAATSASAMLGRFVSVWKLLQHEIVKDWEKIGGTPMAPSQAIELMKRDGRIDETTYQGLRRAIRNRNIIMHDPSYIPSDLELDMSVERMRQLIERLQTRDSVPGRPSP